MVSAFLAGAAEAGTMLIQEKRQYVREATDRRREELRQQGYDRINQSREMRRSLQQYADVLASAGMSQENIVALLEDNPGIFESVAQRVSQLAMNGETPEGINNLVRLAGTSRPSGTSLAEAINNAAPGILRANEGVTDPVRRERNSLAAMFGLSTEAALQRDVYGQELVEGFTGADIAASVGAEPLTSARPGAVQMDFSVLAGPERGMSNEDVLGFIDIAASEYQDMIQRRITELRGEQAGQTVDQLAATQSQITDLERLLEAPTSMKLIENAIEVGGFPATSLIEAGQRVPQLLSPLYFNEDFLQTLMGTEPQTEEETVLEDVTPEAAQEAVTPEAVEPGTVTEETAAQTEEVFESAVEPAVMNEIVTILNEVDVDNLADVRREDFQSVMSFDRDTQSYVPNEDFAAWLQEYPERVEALRQSADVVIQDYLVKTGQVEETPRRVDNALILLERDARSDQPLPENRFLSWQEQTGFEDQGFAKSEAERLISFVRSYKDEFLSWLSEEDRMSRFDTDPMLVMAEFEAS